jgi:hypothetical protein
LVVACESEEPVVPAPELIQAAQSTHSNFVKALNEGKVKSGETEIAPEYWADAVKDHKPVRVYTHRANIVLVLRVDKDGTEEGLYIHIPVSSFIPQTGARIDGFLFNPRGLENMDVEKGVLEYIRAQER